MVSETIFAGDDVRKMWEVVKNGDNSNDEEVFRIACCYYVSLIWLINRVASTIVCENFVWKKIDF